MITAPFTLAPLVVLGLLLFTAALKDLRTRSIDNWVSIAMALAAPVWWIASGWTPAQMGWQAGYAALTFAILFGLWTVRVCGGADVKLIGALALWLPTGERMSTFFVMAMAGAVVAVFAGVTAFTKRRPSGSRIEVPYAVAIAAGGAFFLLRTVN